MRESASANISRERLSIMSLRRRGIFAIATGVGIAVLGAVLVFGAALPVKWVPDIALSDHRGYWAQGFAALMVTDTAHLRNPNYHQSTDRLATLDFQKMTQLCQQLQRTIRRLGGCR